MTSTLSLAVAGSSLVAMVLAGCGTSDPPELPAAGIDAAASTSPLGRIVVDGNGMTAYVFDKDTAGSGTSACTGTCAKNWPAITTSSDTPKVDGITGDVGTIPGADGTKQITIEGLPIHTYADDGAVGDTKGQGKGGVWHVISPAGEKITESAGSGGTSVY
jgi:predicted lipoprotein with Yx(FWY)xxD motif